MSQSVIGALRVVLGLDSAKFESGAKRSKSTASQLGAALGKIAVGAGIAGAALLAITQRTAGIIDAQAKLAQSLGTTVSSVQVLARAGELAGVSMGGIEQATKDLTRRLSQAAAGTGPAIAALDQLGLSATELLGLPLDERVSKINQAILDFVPAAERAAVAGQLFGEEGSLALSRFDPETIATASDELERFGVKLSEVDKAKVEAANDAISRLGLVTQGLANQLTVALAPTVERLAEIIASLTEQGSIFSQVMTALASNADVLVTALGGLAAVLTLKLVVGIGSAIAGLVSMAGSIVALTPIVAALGGPLGVVLALLTAGAAAFLLFGNNSDTAGGQIEEARVALNLLNEALGGFNAAAPTAAGNAIATAQAYAQQAQQALAAAEAEVALMEAEMARFNAAPVEERGLLTGDMEEGAMARNIGLARQEVDSLRESLDLARSRIRQKVTEVASYTGAWQETADTLNTVKVELEGVTDVLDTVAGTGGGGGLKGVADAASEATAGVADLGRELERSGTLGTDIIDGLSGAFSAAIRGADTLKGALSKLADRLADQFLQLGFNQLFGSLFPNLGGFGGFGIPGRAIGDSYTDAGLHLIGERGAELVQLPRGSKVFDHNRTRSMIGGGEAPAPQVSVTPRIVNVLDPRLVGDFLGTPEGEQMIVNVIQRNRGAFGA